jgi:DNA-binding MarR family transcriptional regulator
MQDDRLRGSVGNALVRLFRLVNRTHSRALAPHGLSAEQAHVLVVLWSMGPITIGLLQKQLAVSSATLSGALDRLEAQAMVRRVESPADRRAYVVEPRVASHKREQIENALEETERSCWAGLTAPERRELLRLLDKAIAHLEPRAVAR